MLQRDLPLLADPRGGRGQLLEVGDGLDCALLDGGAVVGKVVVEVEAVHGDVEYLLHRLVELGLLLVDVGDDLPAERLLRVGDARLIRIEDRAVFGEHLLEGAVVQKFTQIEDALELGEEGVVVEDREVVEARLGALAVGVLEGEVGGDLEVLAVPLERMARVDGEELAVDEAFVLPALADAVAVRRHEEEGLVFAEALHLQLLRRALGLDDAAVLEHPRLHVFVAVGEFGREHDLRMPVGILPTHDFQLLRRDPRDARQIVGQRLRDRADGDRVGRLARREAVDLPENRLAAVEDPLRPHEGPRVRGVAA